MTIKGKEPAIITISAVVLISVLSLLFFIRLNTYHGQRDTYTELAGRSYLSSFEKRFETLFDQCSLLSRRLEWECLPALEKGKILPEISKRLFDFQSILPGELGFFVYFLDDDLVLSSFTEIRRSRSFFTSYFIFNDTDAYRWRNIQISSAPQTELAEAISITLNGRSNRVLPVIRTISSPLDNKTVSALVCVYIDLNQAVGTETDFPMIQGGILAISDSLGTELYSLPEKPREKGRYKSLSITSGDGNRVYRLQVPFALFSHRSTVAGMFLVLQAALYLILCGNVILGYYLYTRKRLRTIHGQFETFSKKGAAARFLDQVLIENSGIANSFVIRNHLERNYFIQHSIFTRPPGPDFFNSLASQYDLDIEGKAFVSIRIQLHDISDSYRRRLRTLAIQEFLEQSRSADDIIFDEAPGITGMILSSESPEKLKLKQKKIIHTARGRFKYINFFCGRIHSSLLECLSFWFETNPGSFMVRTENRVWNFRRNDENMLYYYPTALEYALMNSIVNGNSDAAAFICDLIEKENYTERFTGDFDQHILFRELDQTIQKIQINSDIAAAPQADVRNVTFEKYRELFLNMAKAAVRGIDIQPDSESD